MIGYVTLGTNNFEAALEFYDSLFAEIGVRRLWQHGQMAAWGRSCKEISLCITAPFDGKAATVGNGAMVALRMSTLEEVDKLHAKALALGGADEGASGPRGEHGFYGGYFRDLDGNKLNAYLPG